MTPRAFSEVIALAQAGAGVFDAEIDPEWTIGGKANGGYLLAMLGRAAISVGTHPHVLTASAVYLRSPDPGPARVEVELLRGGRSASQLRARLGQDGGTCLEALITTAVLDPDATPFWSGGVPDPGTADDEPMRVPSANPAGPPVSIMDQVDLRLDRATTGFARGEPSGRGELRGSLTLPHGENFDPVSLLYAVDAFPPATFEVQPTGWVPTLELTAHVRALPAPGPVRILHRANLVDGQRVDEDCWVWDATGRMVARSTQLAGIRLG